MPIAYPDNFKIEVVNHYKTHKSTQATLDKYNISKASLFKWVKQFEAGYFLRERKKKPALDPKVKAHMDKMAAIMAARKECKCPVTASVEEKIAAIDRLGDKYSLTVRCEAVQLPRGTYNGRKRRVGNPTTYERADETYKPLIKNIFYESNQRFGCRPIHTKLLEMGYHVEESHICGLMKELCIAVRAPKYRKHHMKPIRRGHLANLLKRDFSPEAPNLAWVGDITYIKVADGYMYLCVIMDLFSRKVIAYHVSDSIDADLTLYTFETAYLARKQPKKLLFHSDQGVQYTCSLYREFLKEHNVKQSFSTPGCPYDNAVCESFFHTLKEEAIYHHIYHNVEELYEALEEYIPFYNNYRPHSFIKMKTPSQFETEYFGAVNQ